MSASDAPMPRDPFAAEPLTEARVAWHALDLAYSERGLSGFRRAVDALGEQELRAMLERWATVVAHGDPPTGSSGPAGAIVETAAPYWRVLLDAALAGPEELAAVMAALTPAEVRRLVIAGWVIATGLDDGGTEP